MENQKVNKYGNKTRKFFDKQRGPELNLPAPNGTKQSNEIPENEEKPENDGE